MSIRDKITQLGLPHSASKAMPAILMSFGVATVIPDQGGSPDTLLCLADNALYQSKDQERNTISITAL